MEDGTAATLFLPFENGELPFPCEGARTLFLNAALPQVSGRDWRRVLECIQGFRPDFLALENAGYLVAPALGAGTYSGALVLLGKHRELNRQNIHAALTQTLPGGTVVVCGAKTSGVEAMRKEMAGLLPVERTLSKNHAQVFWFLRPERWVSPPAPQPVTVKAEGLEFWTAAGMFSHRAVDAGSQMLAGHIGDVEGKAADFGAGWGFLSAMLLRRSPSVTALDLYEADYASLGAAQRNIGALSPPLPVRYHWQDLLAEPVQTAYNAIIMNPPFHAGRSSEASIGQRMIGAAAAALKPGGKLLMVANRELPYEDTLQRAFRRFERIDESRQFKVIRGVK